MNREQVDAMMDTAINGTPDKKAALVEYLLAASSGNIRLMLHLMGDVDSRVANAAISGLEQLQALIEFEGK